MSVDVTAIIPARNRLWALPKAVDSCRSAKLQVQIIVIDDASTDGTMEWLETQPDLEVLRGEGWGKPWGVNKAIALATGKYLRFLDSDDWLNPGANEMQFQIAEREQADVIVAGVDSYQDEVFSGQSPWIPTDDFIAQQLGETPGSHYSAFLFRREFVQDIPHRTLFPASDFASGDDRAFILEVAMRRPRIAACDTPTLCHRHHGKQRLQFRSGLRLDGTKIQYLYIYKQILSRLNNNGQLTERRKRAATKVLWPLAHWIAHTYLEEACKVADWVFKLDPAFAVPEKGLLGALYRHAGFRRTEQLLKVRRTFLNLFRDRPSRSAEDYLA